MYSLSYGNRHIPIHIWLSYLSIYGYHTYPYMAIIPIHIWLSYLSIYGYHFFVSTWCPVWLDLMPRLKNKSNEPQGLFSGGARTFDFGTYGSVTQ